MLRARRRLDNGEPSPSGFGYEGWTTMRIWQTIRNSQAGEFGWTDTHAGRSRCFTHWQEFQKVSCDTILLKL